MDKCILIKLSGESLAGNNGHGFDFEYINKICARIKQIHNMGIGIAIVCGGGNFIRGRDASEMDRVTADYAGMMATIINSLALKDAFIKLGADVYNQSGLDISIMDFVDGEKAINAIKEGKIVIFGGGTGKPFFSTDTAAALRAKDVNARLIIKLTNVSGVYDKDPNKYEDAVKYDSVTFNEVIEKELGVMDLSAMEICRDNNIEIIVTDINDENGLIKIIQGERVGTHVCKGD